MASMKDYTQARSAGRGRRCIATTQPNEEREASGRDLGGDDVAVLGLLVLRNGGGDAAAVLLDGDEPRVEEVPGRV